MLWSDQLRERQQALPDQGIGLRYLADVATITIGAQQRRLAG